MSTRETINLAVKAYMFKEELTQTELGRRIGLLPATVSQRLSGVSRWNVEDIDRLVSIGVLEPVRSRNKALTGQCSCRFHASRVDRPDSGFVEERIVSADRWAAVVRNAALAAWDARNRHGVSVELGGYAPVLVEEMLSNDVLNLIDKGYSTDDVRRIIDTARYTANEALRAEEFSEICGKSLDALLDHIDDEVEQ